MEVVEGLFPSLICWNEDKILLGLARREDVPQKRRCQNEMQVIVMIYLYMIRKKRTITESNRTYKKAVTPQAFSPPISVSPAPSNSLIHLLANLKG